MSEYLENLIILDSTMNPELDSTISVLTDAKNAIELKLIAAEKAKIEKEKKNAIQKPSQQDVELTRVETARRL